jgi:hypothetical protein
LLLITLEEAFRWLVAAYEPVGVGHLEVLEGFLVRLHILVQIQQRFLISEVFVE